MAGRRPYAYGGMEYKITAEMVQFKELPPQNLPAAEFSGGFVYVDIALTPELEAEGYAREIIRRIQDMRKELDLRGKIRSGPLSISRASRSSTWPCKRRSILQARFGPELPARPGPGIAGEPG